jgi:hypothetical protein
MNGAAAAAAQNTRQTQQRVLPTIESLRKTQEAARAAASALNNLGANPNYDPAEPSPTLPDGRTQNPVNLPDVPNGLTAGGLAPDSGVTPDLDAQGNIQKDVNGNTLYKSNPVTTWVNANTPVQTVDADGAYSVTIQQTAQQALLNWTTFNIGRNTTLSFCRGGRIGWR